MGGDDFQASVARDVRNVLRQARSELADLARDAGDLCPADVGARLLAPPPVVMAALPEPSAANDFSSDRTQGPSGGTADHPSEQMPTPGPAAQLATHWRALVIVLVAVAVAATVSVSVRSSARSEAVLAAPGAAESATKAAVAATNSSTASIDASEKAGAGMLSLSLEVRRPAWLQLNVDGEADRGRTYQPGESRTIQAT
jgi:hypothetical protein